MTRILLLFCCITNLQARNELDKLPRWAQAAYHQAHIQPAPAGADAWVLLDRTECAYTGDGEIRLHRYRVVEILTEHALSESVYMLDGLGGNSSKIKKLKGWNLRPDGRLEQLEASDVISFDADNLDEMTTRSKTAAVLREVLKDSLVVWESLESLRYPIGPAWACNLMEPFPIANLEVSLAKQEGWFSNLKAVEASFYPHNLEPYCRAFILNPGKGVQMLDVKPIPEKERGRPYLQDALPWLAILFQDPALKGTPPLASWNGLAAWTATVFEDKATPFLPEGVLPEDRSTALSQMAKWLARSLSYRQVYLNPKRGWIPEESQETLRRQYGDCKDLAACAQGIAAKLGLKAHPTLVSIQSEHVRPEGEVYPYAFNHVITAIQLEKSMGFPAEIQTPKGRFLLYDATAARSTPMGLLPASHRGRSAMICTPDGAVWVAIPDSALQRPSTDSRWKGTVDTQGNFTGTLTIRETGGWLRYALLDSGRKALEKQIAGRMELPPTGHLTLESTSDPMDAASAFQVVAKLEYPNAFQRSGGEWSLARMGIPGVPGLIQPAGKPRQMPVALGGWGSSQYDFDLNVAQELLLPQAPLTLDTPLRHAKASIVGTGHQVYLNLEIENKEATWPYEKREEGVKAQRKDRSQWKDFLEELLTFKPRS